MPKKRQPTSIALFKEKTVRRIWHEERWFFSIIDVIAILTLSENPRRYWSDMKRRVQSEGFIEVYAKIVQLKLEAPDGKLRETDCADTETILRIIQSIPSPRAEPFKQWLAQVGTDRLEEIENPEVLTARQRDYYIAKGYPEDWIEARQRGQVARNELTDTWKARGAEEGIEYAILTNEIATATFGVDVSDHMQIKGLERRDNLRDHMTRLELLLVEVGETATRAIHDSRDSEGFEQLARDAHDGGAIAGRTRADIETQTGQPVVSPENYRYLTAGKPPALEEDNEQVQQKTLFDGDE